MANVREDLEADDPLRQTTALLQVLNYIAGGREISSGISYVCQSVLRGPAAPLVKRLAYDVVHTAALTDADWDAVIEGLKSDLAGTFSLEVQVVALECLPRIPADKLSAALGSEDLAKRILLCLSNSSKEVLLLFLVPIRVRAAATGALGCWLASAEVLSELAGRAELAQQATAWAEAICTALLDPAHAVSAAGFDAIRLMLGEQPGPQLAGAAAAGQVLQERLACLVSARVLGCLAPVMSRARLLAPKEQVSVAGALSRVAEYAARRDFRLPVSGGGDSLAIPKGPFVLDQVCGYLQVLLSSINAPVVLEAAAGILALAKVADRVLAAAPILAIGALMELWDHDSSAASHSQIMDTICANLDALQARAQSQLLGQLLPMVAQLPAAQARCQALARICTAAVASDLETRRAVRIRQKTLPGAELKQLLSDPFVMEVVSGSSEGAKDSVAPDALYPAFREELVCSLLQTLISNPRAEAASRAAAAPDQAQENSISDAVQALSLQQTPPATPGNAWEELQKEARAIAAQQRVAELTEWLGCAKIALQGTKACLGWERAPEGGTYACTAVTDTWLELLQLAFCAARRLPKGVATPAASRRATAELDVRLGNALVSYSGALQDLLRQLLQHWKVVSPAIQPRALWAFVPNLELASTMDATWMHFMRALAAALSASDDLSMSRKKRAAATGASEGRLKAATSNNPFAAGKADTTLSATADEPDIQAEAAAMAILAAERLAQLLDYNAERLGPTAGLKEVAGSLMGLLQAAASSAQASAATKERLNRAVQTLSPIAAAALPPEPALPAEARQHAQSSNGTETEQRNGDLAAAPDAAGPAPASTAEHLLHIPPAMDILDRCPLAAPTGAALQSTKRGSRYWRLRSVVAAAVARAGSLGGEVDTPAQQGPEPPPLPSKLEVFDMATSSGQEAVGTEVTGPEDPLRLTVWHSLDRITHALTLGFQAFNRLTVEIKGAGIRLAVGGAAVAAVRAPAVHKLATIPAGEAVSWRASFRVTSFDRISLQAFILLPAKCTVQPGEEPSIRCQLYTISPLSLLCPPAARPLDPTTFFQRWSSAPSGMEAQLSATRGGAVGGLLALSALERGSLRRVALQALPCQGGFLGLYHGESCFKSEVSLVLTGQLLPCERPAIHADKDGPGRVVMRVSIRSASPHVIAALQADLHAFFQELFEGTATMGVMSDSMPLVGIGKHERQHSNIAALAQLYLPHSRGLEQANGLPLLEEDPGSADEQAMGEEDAVMQEWQRVRMARAH